MHGLQERVGDAGSAEGAGKGDVDSLHCCRGFRRRGASRAASICCLSWLKRMPRAFLASGGADFSHASLMSLRRPCLRPSQWRRKTSCASGFVRVDVSERTSSARVAKAASREGSSWVRSWGMASFMNFFDQAEMGMRATRVVGSGMGSPSARRPSMWKAMPSRMSCSVAS